MRIIKAGVLLSALLAPTASWAAAPVRIPTPVPRPFDLDTTPAPVVAAAKADVTPSPEAAAPDSPVASAEQPAIVAPQPVSVEPAPPRGGLKALVAREASRLGLPFSLADAVIEIESRYNPHAAHRGNMGLTQISTATARANGFIGEAVHLLEPETNLKFGLKVLASAFQAAKGDVCGTLMRYQSGHLATRMTAANRQYCGRARAIMAKI